MTKFFKTWWKVVVWVFVVVLLLILSSSAQSETLYCTASSLNGRASPSINARVEAHFEYGDELEVIGYNDNWIEVEGGETGTVFVSAKYVASSLEKVKYKNTSGGRVIIREEPDGKKTNHWVKAGKKITISAELDGWGYIADRGWVNLSYFSEVE